MVQDYEERIAPLLALALAKPAMPNGATPGLATPGTATRCHVCFIVQ